MNFLHNQIIGLGVKHPDLQELIEFIVFINDRLTTRGSQAEDIVSYSFTALIKLNKELIDANVKMAADIKLLHNKKGFWSNVLSKITNINDVKTIMGLAFVVVLVVSKMFYPESSSELYNEVISILIGKK